MTSLLDTSRRAFGLGLAALAATPAAWAQDTYPSRPIRLVVPWPAGGSSDAAARIFADQLSRELKTPIVVDNKGGASGRIGIQAGLQSAADGYTLILVNSSTNVSLPVIEQKIEFDPVESFSLLAPVAIVPSVIVAHPSVPASNLKELIAYARANPGKLTYASPGQGSTHHLNGELFSALAGIKLLHVPYKGGAQARVDLLAGRVDLFITDFGVLEDIRHGRLKAFATNAPARVSLLPELPTAVEEGLAGFDRVAWHGLAFQPGVPAPIVATVVDAINRAARSPEVAKRLAAVGLVPGGGNPQSLRASIVEDLRSYREIVQKLDIKPGA